MLKPADVNKMLVKQDNPVNMILEQANLGRGKHWFVIRSFYLNNFFGF
jgi:hypothetical protein